MDFHRFPFISIAQRASGSRAAKGSRRRPREGAGRGRAGTVDAGRTSAMPGLRALGPRRFRWSVAVLLALPQGAGALGLADGAQGISDCPPGLASVWCREPRGLGDRQSDGAPTCHRVLACVAECRGYGMVRADLHEPA